MTSSLPRAAFLGGAVAAALAFAATGTAAKPAAAPHAPGAAGPRFAPWGFDLAGRDLSVRPGDDFYDYANGTWASHVAFDADLPAAGVTIDLYKAIQQQLRDIVEASAAAPKTPTAEKVGGLYRSFMDEARLETLDDKPLQADLARIRAAASKAELAELMGGVGFGFGASPLKLGVTIDSKHPDQYAVAGGVSGLGLPDRDYYLAPSFAAQKAAYLAYIGRALAMVGWPEPQKTADAVLAFETRIAEASLPRAERRDPNKMYVPVSWAELKAQTPGFEWEAYRKGWDGPAFDRIILSQSTAFPKVAQAFAETPLEILKAWEAFHTVRLAAPYLSKRFVDSGFEFNKVLGGQAQQRPRWNRGVVVVDGNLGEALGREYVARHFPASSKAQMEKLVANLQRAMRGRIERADWMSPTTRAEALRKLALQRVKVGYPNKWRDYGALTIDPADLYGNIKRSIAFETRHDQARLGKPVDRDEWFLTPQTLNAYFNPVGNEVVFPAAYLQPPAFDPRADLAVNYGAIGAVIGHEISHGFDDQGRQYDATGTLRDWWTAQDAARFNGEAAKLVTQYGRYEPIPGSKINGKLTLGENIGDLGGVLVALDAYHAALGGKPAPVIDGLTGDQRFFLGWSQTWRNKYRDAILKVVLASDPHSPDRFRVDGVLPNVDAWYKAFNVQPGDKLYIKPEDRSRVW